MVTRTFLVGVLIGLLIAAAAVYVRDKVDRLENLENYLGSHPIPSMAMPQAEHEHGMSYGRPEQEAL